MLSPSGDRGSSGKATNAVSENTIKGSKKPSLSAREQKKSTSKASYESGVEHGLAGRYEEAIKAFQGTIINEPSDADAHFGLGHALFNSGRWDEAAEAFKRVVAINPKDYEAYLYLGASYFRSGQYEQAIDAYKSAVLLKRQSSEARYNIAHAFLRMKLYEPAITYYQDVATFRPKSSEVYNDLGVAYGQSGQYEKAMEALKRAVSLDSGNAYAQSNLAITYYLLGKYSDAIKAIDRAGRLAPEDFVIQSNHKLAYEKLNGAEIASGEPVSLVNAGGQSTAEGMRWLSRSDVVLGIREKDESAKATEDSAPLVPRAAAPAAAVDGLTLSRSEMPSVTMPEGDAHSAAKPAVAPAKAETPVSNNVPAEETGAAFLVNLYRVGVGDVLDIRLLNESTDRSTLYAVLAGGVLEHPVVDKTFNAVGKTVEEIAAHIKSELHRRALQPDSGVLVNVREYASHVVMISGLVAQPGEKVIKREAIPLYVIVAAAQPLPEAARVTVTSYATGQTTHVALNDQATMNILVRPGDVIAVSKKLQEFYYVSGDVSNPGQKDFHEGITLTQAIMAAGGKLHKAQNATRAWTRSVLTVGVIAPSANREVSVTRANTDGRLVTTSYDLKDILSGKEPDPLVKAGDRIEVRR
ncbi:MAG TPA: tetratricopeptide repeat protein [Pyrinomonadaceae bacterium]